MAKVSIVKWSQKLIFVDGTSFFGPTPDFKIAFKTAIFKIFGYARNGTSVNKNPFLRPLYNRYFCHITIVKWSRIIQKSIKKCIFWDILILCPFSIRFPTVTLKIYQHRKEKSYRGSRDSFGNGMTRVITRKKYFKSLARLIRRCCKSSNTNCNTNIKLTAAATAPLWCCQKFTFYQLEKISFEWKSMFFAFSHFNNFFLLLTITYRPYLILRPDFIRTIT